MKQKYPTIEKPASIRDALKVIDSFGKRICYVIENSRLVGVLTDGDIRRSLLKGTSISDTVESIMNRDFVSFPVETNSKTIRDRFSDRVRHIPLLDKAGALVDVADPQGNFRIPVLEPLLNGNELRYVSECIQTNWISSQGKFVQEFENMFEEYHPHYHALAVSNGTVALQLSLLALGIGKGDEVIVPNVTFAASANAVIYCGADPVLCEIDRDTWCIDAEEAGKLISSKTKAILPVHLYGQPCNMKAIAALASSHGLFLIEDCAEAIGSAWGSKKVGTFGDASTFSFFGNKTITTGEGGMVLFKDESIKNKAKILRDHGMSPTKRYWHDEVGHNFRLTNMQAAVGVAQMEKIQFIISKKIEIQEIYKSELGNIEEINALPCSVQDTLHSNWLFTIILQENIDRENLIMQLLQRGVDCRPCFYSLSEMPPYKKFKKSLKIEKSLLVSSKGLSLPSSVSLSTQDIIMITNVIKKIFSEN